MHDPRAYSGWPRLRTSPRGACHMQGDMYAVGIGRAPVELGVRPGDRFEADEETGRIAARLKAWRNVYNALNLCQFQNPGPDAVARQSTPSPAGGQAPKS